MYKLIVMKYMPITLLLFTFNLIGGQSPSRQNQLPEIFLVYPKMGTSFDRKCAVFLNKPVKEEWLCTVHATFYNKLPSCIVK